MQSLKEFREHGSRHYQVKSIAQAIGVTEPHTGRLNKTRRSASLPKSPKNWVAISAAMQIFF